MKLATGILLPLWTLLFLLFRPSILGERFNQHIFVVFFFVTVAILIFGPVKKLSLSNRRLAVLAAIYLCVLYFAVQGLMLSSSRQTVINSVVFIALVVPCIAVILSMYQELVLKIFINFHVFLSWSAIVTFAIFILVGLDANRIPVVADLYPLVKYAVYDPIRPLSNHLLFFPYTVAWSTSEFLGVQVPRAVGIYREPGMSQIFFLTALMLTYFIEVKNLRRKRIVLFIGSVLLFSAAGLVHLVICIFFLSLVKASVKETIIRFIKKPVVVILGVVVFIFLIRESINLINIKLEDLSGSGRLESFTRGITALAQNPIFGNGYYNSFTTDSEGVLTSLNVIGLPGVSAELGLVGLTLYLLCWYFSMTLLGTKRTLIIYLPCLLTLALSQPSYNDAFSWFIILLDTRHFNFNS